MTSYDAVSACFAACVAAVAIAIIATVGSCQRDIQQKVAEGIKGGVDPIRVACAYGNRQGDICMVTPERPCPQPTECPEPFSIPKGCTFFVSCEGESYTQYGD